MSTSLRSCVLVGLLTLSAAGFAFWQGQEGFADKAMIPTKGDVPTLGYGSTRWEDGSPVKLGQTITRERAVTLAKALNTQEERRLKASIPGVKLHQEEFDVYADFVGNFGIGNWNQSSMRRNLLAGDYAGACKALLKYRYAAGFDCSTPGNKRCYGVWDRQQKRFNQCMAAQ